MPGFQIIEIIIGLLTLYIFLSIAFTALNELVDWLFLRRDVWMAKGLRNIINNDKDLETFYGHPFITSIIHYGKNFSSLRFKLLKLIKFWDAEIKEIKGIKVFYWNIPDELFTDTVIDMVIKDETNFFAILKKLNENERADLSKNDLTRQVLIQFKNASGNMDKARDNIKRWYNSAWYPYTAGFKRQTMFITFILALLTVSVLNLDSLMIARILWSNRIITRIHEIGAGATCADSGLYWWNEGENLRQYLERLDRVAWRYQHTYFLFGWADQKECEQCAQRNPRFSPKRWEDWISKVIGLLITALAVSLGTEFWFGILERFIRAKK